MDRSYFINTHRSKPELKTTKYFYILPMFAITEEASGVTWLYAGWFNFLYAKRLSK